MNSFKNKFALAFCAVLLMSSCLPSENAVNPLTGTWTLKGISCQNCIDKAKITSTTYSCDESGCNTYSFQEDGKLTVTEIVEGAPKITDGVYAISDRTVTIHLNDVMKSSKTYSFTLSGSMLYLKDVVQEYNGQCGATTVLSK